MKDSRIMINKKDSINFFEHVNFVAIKNGEHRSNGYVFSIDDIKNNFPKNDFHVKNLFQTISNYFI